MRRWIGSCGMKVPTFLKLCALFTLLCELQALPLADNLTAKCGGVKCQDGEVCQKVGGKPVCAGPSDGTCMVGVSKHKTFDGLHYDFQGSCTHTVAKSCDNNNKLPAFHIKARNGNSSLSVTAEITYPQHKYVLNMKRDRSVKVNDNIRQGDFTLDKKINIYQTGIYVLIQTDFDLIIKYYMNSTMKVSLPSSFSQNVHGMCGNYNRDPTDDFATSSGTQAANLADFGKAWKVNDGGSPPCND